MNTKKEFRRFTVFNHEDEEAYLRQMHNKGWKFVKVTGFGMYHFKACQPEDVVYQLDYNKEGSAHKDEYIRMFADCGWDYLMEYAEFSYFRKPAAQMNGEETIFCDDESRLEMMNRIYKGRFLPLLTVFTPILIVQFVLNLLNGHYGLAIMFAVIMVIYAIAFGFFAVKYHNFKSKLGK